MTTDCQLKKTCVNVSSSFCKGYLAGFVSGIVSSIGGYFIYKKVKSKNKKDS
tara:strand:- start:277 stop:432 length:156 start_codon:yes stop_codon:yes gene_type:complete